MVSFADSLCYKLIRKYDLTIFSPYFRLVPQSIFILMINSNICLARFIFPWFQKALIWPRKACLNLFVQSLVNFESCIIYEPFQPQSQQRYWSLLRLRLSQGKYTQDTSQFRRQIGRLSRDRRWIVSRRKSRWRLFDAKLYIRPSSTGVFSAFRLFHIVVMILCNRKYICTYII